MELKPRLKVIADEIAGLGSQDTVIDIGTDHAYLPIWLIQQDICAYVVATDIRQGPLNKAYVNVKKTALEDRIQLVCGDGLQAVPDGLSGSVVVMAGMGGLLLSKLVLAGIDKLRDARMLILQPMNSQEVLRQELVAMGVHIGYERLVQEDRRVYNILVCHVTDPTAAPGNGMFKPEPYAPEDYYIGKRHKDDERELFLRHLKFVRRKVSNRLDGLERSKDSAQGEEAASLRGIVAGIDEQIRQTSLGS